MSSTKKKTQNPSRRPRGKKGASAPPRRTTRARRETPTSDQFEDVSSIFAALGDTTRVKIIQALLDTERSVGNLAETLDFSISAVSHQLRRLKDLKIVRSRRKGQNVYYALDDAHVAGLFQMALDHVRHKKSRGARTRGRAS